MKILRLLSGLGALLALGAAARPSLAQGTGRMWVAPAPESTPAAPAGSTPQGVPPAQDVLGRRLERLARKLDLAGPQREAWRAAFAGHRDQLDRQGQAVQAASRALRTALVDPERSPEALGALNRTLADARLGFFLEARALRGELAAGLSPEQRRRATWMERRLADPDAAGPGDGLTSWDPGDPDRLLLFEP